MPRMRYLASPVRFLLLLALLTLPVAAQKSASVDHVIVRGPADAIEVEIQTSGNSVSPNTQAITGPNRIIVDFPGAVPSSALRALTVNRGALKSVRSGLFFDNPPITRIVLDLSEAQSYHISAAPNGVVVKLGAATAARNQSPSAPPGGAQLRQTTLVSGSEVAPVKFSPANLPGATVSIVRVPVPTAASGVASSPPPPGSTISGPPGSTATASAAAMNPDAASVPPAVATVIGSVADATPIAPPEPPKPTVTVSYENGQLSIQSDRATLAQVLYEIHLKTQADIAIPAGAEQEQVVTNLGPGPARDVLSALLNGSPYNFIFVGTELSLERVILTRRDPNLF
jgi:hypothetical protein